MPNWCTNKLIITGDDSDVWGLLLACCSLPETTLERVVDAEHPDARRRLGELLLADEIESFSFNGVVPMPAELKDGKAGSDRTAKESAELNAKYGHDDWYHWSIANWGTKWDVDGQGQVNVEVVEEGHVELLFDTAWGPPVAWAAKASARFPKLTLRLEGFEPGCGYCGWQEFAGGGIVGQGDWLTWASLTDFYDDEEA